MDADADLDSLAEGDRDWLAEADSDLDSLAEGLRDLDSLALALLLSLGELEALALDEGLSDLLSDAEVEAD